jgi:hypothetical protein
VNVWRNKWRKNGEHSAGVYSPAQQISARIFPYNHHHTHSHIMAITGSSITQTTRTSALDTQTPLQIRRSTQDNSGVPGCRLENRCSIPGVERDFFFRSAKHQDRLWVRPRLLFDGYQELVFITQYGRSVEPNSYLH